MILLLKGNVQYVFRGTSVLKFDSLVHFLISCYFTFAISIVTTLAWT